MARKTEMSPATKHHPFLLSVHDVAQQLNTNIETGLTARQVSSLQDQCPPNELEDEGGFAWYKILVKQISNAMILVSVPYPTSKPGLDIFIGSSVCHGSKFWRRGPY
jgi:Na+-exporting ATPase